jgi:hypothetical protein
VAPSRTAKEYTKSVHKNGSMLSTLKFPSPVYNKRILGNQWIEYDVIEIPKRYNVQLGK